MVARKQPMRAVNDGDVGVKDWAQDIVTHDLPRASERDDLAVFHRADVVGVARREVCLLYTSPSPRDATLSRMPSSA